MKDKDKTEEQLITELAFLRQRIGELEASETERKRMEEALQKSEAKYRNITESLNELIYRADPDTLVATYVNSAIERIYGYTVEEWLKEPSLWENTIHPDDKERVFAEFTEVQEKMESAILEYRIIRKDKAVRWVKDYVNWEKDQQGRIVSMNGLMYDVTERKQAEKQLLRQNAVLDAINRVFSETLASETDEEVARMCLAVAEELTDSKFGFIGEVNQAGRYDCIALSDPGWEECRIPESDAVVMLKDLEIQGIWGRVIKDEQSLIVNEPETHPDSIGIPEGHPPLTSFMGVPLKHAGKTIGMIGLANKESGYDKADQEAIETLSTPFVGVLGRKRVENELWIKNNAIDSSISGINITDLEGKITYANDAMLEMVGVKSEKELLGKTPLDIVYDKEETLQAIKEVQEKGRWSGETTIKRIDGSPVNAQLLANLVKDVAGQPVGMMTSFIDITERKQVEAELIRMSNAVKMSIDSIVISNFEGNIIDVNEAALKMYGTNDKEELMGKNSLELIAPEYREEAFEGMKETLEKGHTEGREYHVITKDGSEIPVEISAAIMKGADGKTIGFVGITRDITERKRAEEQAKRQSVILEATNRLIVETLVCESDEEVAKTCLVVAEELTSSKFGFIGEVNQAGRFDTIAISNPGWDACIIPKTSAVLMLNDLDIRGIRGRVIKEERAMIFNEPASHPDWIEPPEGHPKITSFLGVPLKRAGRLIGMIGLANKESGYNKADQQAVESLSVAFVEALYRKRAETERKLMEEELIRKNSNLETLLYVTSHDLKEPLRAIQNFSNLVNNRYADRLDEKGQDFLRRVVRGAERMERLIDEILVLSRAQRMVKPTEEVEGETIVRDALKRLEGKIIETDAKIQVAEDLPQFHADKTWVTQAVYNLIANALKFTSEGEAPDIEIAPYRPEDDAKSSVGIVVRDRGPGVAPEYAERIFGLFQRAVGREVEGTGAGLAIVRQIAERHGGRAWVQPREGGGSEFIITFGKSKP